MVDRSRRLHGPAYRPEALIDPVPRDLLGGLVDRGAGQ